MQLKKCTPVLIVDAIEPSLAFWQQRLGFSRPVEVPHGDGLGFVTLTKGTVEVMYQTVASVDADMPGHLDDWHGDRSHLYVEVDDIDAVAAALSGCEIVLPKRKTFYGATEVGYREPGGHFVTFAQMRST
jgi:uncharacterized glyoxalase superfamily protein PhnB